MPAPERYTPEQVLIYEQVRAEGIEYGFAENLADYTARGQAEGFEIPDPAGVAKRTGKSPVELKLDAAAAASAAARHRRPLDWTALANKEIPQRDWAIDHWLGMLHVTLLAGPGGGGKSLLAQQIGSALALGRPFIDAVPSSRTVLMWAAEDDEHELWRRQQAIAQSMNVDLQDFAGKFIVESFDGRDCTLAAVSYGSFGVTAKLEDFRQQANDCRVDVAILDNIARLYGGNENDRHQVTAFIAELVGATAERGAAVLLLGHPGRASGSEFSGSSAWENAVRARLWLSDKLPDQPRDDGAEPESDVRSALRRNAKIETRPAMARGRCVCTCPSRLPARYAERATLFACALLLRASAGRCPFSCRPACPRQAWALDQAVPPLVPVGVAVAVV